MRVIFSAEYTGNAELLSRFKIRHTSRHVGKHVAARYKEVKATSQQDVQMSGYLKLRSGRGGKWRQSWWVLKDRVLYRFEAMEDSVAKETLPVLGWTLETLSDVRRKYFQREMLSKYFCCRKILSCTRA